MSFLHQNQIDPYPLDPAATLTDDAGQVLPESVLSDLSIAMPESYGHRAFLSSVSLTDEGCAIVISAANADRTVLAIGETQQPVDFRKTLSLQPMVDGVFGQWTPGEWVNSQFNERYRFSAPAQSYLAPRVVFPMPIVEKQTFGVFYAGSPLQQIVDVVAAGDLEAAIEQRQLDGRDRRALVLRLREVGISGQSSLEQYAEGMPRPEARTCGDPQPVESINNVQPDCCNRIYIELRGCAVPIRIANRCGVALDCPHEADALCPPEVILDGSDQQNDDCIEEGYPAPIDVPANRPRLPGDFFDRSPW